MVTLASDKPRDYYEGDIHEFPVIASDIIYGGAAVGDDGNGYARPLEAGDPFRGFAEQKVDNATGSAGDKNVRSKTRGKIRLPISGLAITDVGSPVYASDDDTFTLTQGSNTRIGYVHAFVSTGVGIVAFHAAVGDEAELTDNSGGTADDTIAAVSGSGDDATINNNFADLSAKMNHLLRQQGG